MDWFLVQVNATDGYKNIKDNRRYANKDWMNKPRDRAQREVKPGDSLLVYCTSNVPNYGMSLAFSVVVREVSPDKVTFELDEPHEFPSRLHRTTIHSLIDEGKLASTFSKCGNQSFTIAKLEPLEAQQALTLVEVEPPVRQDSDAGPPGSPFNGVSESYLEQWLVENWDRVDFGARLRLFEENGESVGQQYNTRSVGRIDLLCEDSTSGALVVIELKKGRPSDAVVGQLARYMGWVKENLAAGREVQGIVLTPEYDDKLRYAAKAVQGIRLLRYEIRLEIFPQDS